MIYGICHFFSLKCSIAEYRQCILIDQLYCIDEKDCDSSRGQRNGLQNWKPWSILLASKFVWLWMTQLSLKLRSAFHLHSSYCCREKLSQIYKKEKKVLNSYVTTEKLLNLLRDLNPVPSGQSRAFYLVTIL